MSEQPETVDLDLFGQPVQPIRERWGRPRFAKNKENQEVVALLAASGWRQSRIAAYLGCDEKTLRKHFSRQLKLGRDEIWAMSLQVLYKKMRAGNGPATNKLLDIIEAGSGTPVAPAEPAKKETLGRKVQRELAAAEPPPTAWGHLNDIYDRSRH